MTQFPIIIHYKLLCAAMKELKDKKSIKPTKSNVSNTWSSRMPQNRRNKLEDKSQKLVMENGDIAPWSS